MIIILKFYDVEGHKNDKGHKNSDQCNNVHIFKASYSLLHL